MKKVIFISALAIAAAASCTKSDIVDTKFNEAISFEGYIGRAAQTKATVIDNDNIDDETIGLYGFYTGEVKWDDESTPNLWANDQLYNPGTGWKTDDKKYWTNASDYYSFLAYAPYATETNGLEATEGANPKVTYTVPVVLDSQSDLLYAQPVFDMQRGETENPTPVKLTMKHALSRIAVKANEKHPDYSYTITGLSIKGDFVQENTFSLVETDWAAETTETVYEQNPYNFTVVNAAVDATNGADATNNEYVACTGEKYLMVIPTDVEAAVLTVKYKTTYGTGDDAVTSAEITKTVEIAQEFKQGKAYTINLTFEPNASEEITFTVDVNLWDTVDNNDTEDTSDDVTVETPINGSVQS